MRPRLGAYTAALGLLGPMLSGAADPRRTPQGPSPLSVKDEGNLSCASAAQLLARVEQRLGHRLPRGPGAAILARVRRSRVGESWSARIELKRTASNAALGERSLAARGRTCKELDASLVLVLALMLDAPGSAEGAAQGHLTGAADETLRQPSKGTRSTGSRPEPQPRSGGPGSLSLLGFGALSLGTLPGVGIGAGFGGMWAKGPLGAGVDVVMWPYAEQVSGDRGTRFFHGAARTFACVVRGSASQSLSGCGSVRVGWLSAEGFGYETNRAEDRLTLGPGLSLRAEATLSDALGASVEAGVEVALLRHRFVVQTEDGGQRATFRMWRALPFLTVGLDFRIW